MKKSSSPAAKPATPTGREMKGADAVVECLIREGVEVIFAYPGGSSQELHQSLARTDKIRVILPRHEQGGGFAAEGYARATGKVGVCMATSGPGATNLVSAIADAYMDSIPLVAITGQVYSKYIGKMAFQETDFFGMTLPIVKHSLPRHGRPRAAAHLQGGLPPRPQRPARPRRDRHSEGRPAGEVHARFIRPRSSSATPTPRPQHHADDEQLKAVLAADRRGEAAHALRGGGIISAGAHRELQAFAERTNIPVATTLMGVGAFPETHPLSMQWFGMHGAAYGNWAVDQCDLLLVLGARFDDRITGDAHKFAAAREDRPHRHRRLRAQQEQARPTADLRDIKHALGRLNELMAAPKFTAPDTKAWHDQIADVEARQSLPLRSAASTSSRRRPCRRSTN